MEFFNNIYFNIIDIIIIAILLTSCIVATFRGFIKEAFSVISWLFSLMAAFHLYERFKLELLNYLNQEIIIDIIAFGFPFLTIIFTEVTLTSKSSSIAFLTEDLSAYFDILNVYFPDSCNNVLFSVTTGEIIMSLKELIFIF